MDRFKQIFKKESRIVIGAIHLPPLLGYPDFPGLDRAIKNALQDLKALEAGGVDGVLFENNYDIPHHESVPPATVAGMALVGEEIIRAAKVPVGVSVLWNDYVTAFSLAKLLNLSFIRLPVLVDTVKTAYGIVRGNPKAVSAARQNLKASHIALFADIHVKHAKLLSRTTIQEAGRQALKEGADAVIVTGKWTGDAPDLEELASVRQAIGSFPILAGSGVDEKNIKDIFKYADGAIVSTALKKGKQRKNLTNIKDWTQRIDAEKVKILVSSVRKKL